MNKLKETGIDLNTIGENDQFLPGDTMSHFERQIVYENGWTNSTLFLMKYWLKLCNKRSQIHSEYAANRKIKHGLLSVPSIATGAAATAMAFWVVGSATGTSFGVSVAVAVLSCLSSIFKGMEALFRFGEEEQRHIGSVSSYEEICRKIEINIFRNNNTRVPVENLLSEISRDYNLALTQSPYIKFRKTDYKK